MWRNQSWTITPLWVNFKYGDFATIKMKQTAVEWLVGQLTFKTSGGVYTTDGIDDVTNLVEQAKEMERLQISETYAEASINAIQGLIDEHNDNHND